MPTYNMIKYTAKFNWRVLSYSPYDRKTFTLTIQQTIGKRRISVSQMMIAATLMSTWLLCSGKLISPDSKMIEAMENIEIVSTIMKKFNARYRQADLLPMVYTTE